jgi:EpsI family protein
LAILVGIFCLCTGILYSIDRMNSHHKTAADISNIPMTIGDWKSEDVPVYDETRNVLETDAILMRNYHNAGKQVLLAVVYYRDSRVALHLPESCYTGQGSQIVERGREKIGNFYANRFLLEGNKGNKMVMYYFLTGNYITGSYGSMRLKMMQNRILGKDTGCALVRLTIQRSESDIPSSDVTTLRNFAQTLNTILPRFLT